MVLERSVRPHVPGALPQTFMSLIVSQAFDDGVGQSAYSWRTPTSESAVDAGP